MRLLSLILLFCQFALAEDIPRDCNSEDKPAGAHTFKPGEVGIFKITKNKNPENIATLNTYADRDCHFTGDIKEFSTLFDFYWIMNSKTQSECYKPMNAFIKQQVRSRYTPIKLSPEKDKLTFSLDLEGLDHDFVGNPMFELTLARGPGGKCEATTTLQLGPKFQQQKIVISEIYGSKDDLLPTAPDTVEIRGKTESGTEIAARFVKAKSLFSRAFAFKAK